MSYIDENLIDNEKVIHRGKLHFMSFLPGVMIIILGVLFGGTEFGGFIIFFGVLAFIASLINYIKSEYGVTNKRVIMKTGALRKKVVDLQYSQLESVQYNQGILGGILGYGQIVITGSGGTKFKFPNISNANEFKNKAQNELSKK